MNKYERSILESRYQEKYVFNLQKEKNKNTFLNKKYDSNNNKNKDVNQKQT